MKLEKHDRYQLLDLNVGGKITFAEVDDAITPKNFKAIIEGIENEDITVRILDVSEKNPSGKGVPMAKFELEGEAIIIPPSAIKMYRK